MKFDLSVEDSGAQLRVRQGRSGWLSAFQKSRPASLLSLPKEELSAALAIVKLRQLDPQGSHHRITQDAVFLGHHLVSSLDARSAAALGLPPPVHGIVFRARLVGTVGSPDFRIEWWWERNGRTVSLPINGAFVGPSSGLMRLPRQIYEAIDLAEATGDRGSLTDHWLALGRFRRLFDAEGPEDQATLEGFLKDISVVTCTAVGIGFEDDDETKFFPIPYTMPATDMEVEPSAGNAALRNDELAEFRRAVLRRGSQPAFRVANGKFLIVDPSAAPIVQTIVDHAVKDEDGRKAFIADAGRIIGEAIELQMMRDGRLTELMSLEARTEKLEGETSRIWVETAEWISRVIGIAKWRKSEIDGIQGSGTTWLPASFDVELGDLLAMIEDDELPDVLSRLRSAAAAGEESIQLPIGRIPTAPIVIEVLARRLAELLRQQAPREPSSKLEAYLPVTHDNFWEMDFSAATRTRKGELDSDVPPTVRSTLQPHQLDAFNWQIAAWNTGVPGILNADEQGLGKTLQTLSLIAWLKERMVAGGIPHNPFLIVAPTSLLLNWEAEIDRHIEAGFLGEPVRLYGEHLKSFRLEGSKGQDIRQGEEQLDVKALSATRGGSPIIITTYQTLANYAISLMGLHCAVAVFDEIQFLKNPVTMRAKAAKSVDADFRIGLTGTPIENATKDLWAIMDQLFPGALGALAQFRRVFDAPTEEGMSALYAALFKSQHGRPALAMRRLKTDAAPHLPSKVRILHPREMSDAQALRYDEARHKGGMMLAVLQHIRRISLHPGLLEGETTEEFNVSSARVSAAIDILRHIKSKNERALVFIENRDVQAWFAEVVRLEFGLERVMVINGDNTVDSRKDITDRFQRHLEDDRGFDVLVLGPRAAGTGLTLTAANHVIHLSRWWNPAVEEQCNDRTHRIGQTRPVTIHIPLAVHPKLGPGSFDCLLQRLMKRKRTLAERILWPAEATQGETRMLYDAVVSADKVVDERPADVEAILDGRSDLETDIVSPETIRVRSRRGGASVVISSAVKPPPLKPEIGGDAVFISMDSGATSAPVEGVVPHSKLASRVLWPDFVLPE